jgi:HTH-type transcriptional repressor of NAD biosynthesis genes
MKKYKRGLILGKFMPITKGHEALVDYGLELCDEIVLLVCTTPSEPIQGELRYSWVRQVYRDKSVTPLHLVFDERDLASSSVPAKDISKAWAEHIKWFVPEVDVFISSEPYGEMVAEYMRIENEYFDTERITVDISATKIRQNPYLHWDMISQPVQDYFFKKVIFVGTESTGKTEMARRMAERFDSDWVHEVGRDLIPDTHACTQEDLMRVAKEHAKNILMAEQPKNKILFIDTDINITKSYFGFLFKEDMQVDEWMKLANKGDLYIYLEVDAPYVQDGTRMSPRERMILDASHKEQLARQGIQYFSVFGKTWKEREMMVVDILCRQILLPNTINQLYN